MARDPLPTCNIIQDAQGCVDGDDMWCIPWTVMSCEVEDVPGVEMFDPFGRQIKSCPNGQFEVQEAGVFNVSIWLLVVDGLVLRHLVPQPLYLFAKMSFHFTMSYFMGSNSFE
jgi:hypothetical protein